MEDEGRVLLWRNDPVTRQFSFDERAVAAEDHSVWFRAKLHDPESVLLIAEDGGVPVAQVRLDRLDHELAEIHIAVAPESRGRGVATQAVQLAVRDAASLLGVTRILARVKPANEASLRLFERAGFSVRGTHPDVIEFERPLGP
jgi:RimJ/RimL family protein N-acetyltransferase